MKKRMDDKYKRDCVKQNSVKETIEDRWENCKIDKVSRGHGVEKAGKGTSVSGIEILGLYLLAVGCELRSAA